MKEMKRILALVLCFVMLVGLVPAAAFTAKAAEETIYVLAGGDFQAGDAGQEDHYYSRINMGNILDKIKETHDTMDGFIFVGDYNGDTHNDSNAATGVAAMMEEVSERYTSLNHDNSYLIEGNHETGAVSGVDATGGYDCDGYAVYLINETDFCEKQEGKSSQIQTVANNLKAWLNNKIGEGYDAPIFVATHTPLGYTTRTYTNGDSLYGKYVFDVLNDAAANGLNIIFLHGHDHAYGADNYLGGEAIYLPVGDKINICVPGDKTAWTEETLNFTYMNAGYVGYYNENYYDVTSYEEEKLTMTVFAITGNEVKVERYSKDGLYNLKSAGREGFYNNASTCANIGLAYNTATYASPQTIALNAVEDYGDIGNWVGIEAETPADDVTPSNEGWVELIAPIPGTPEVPATPESTKYVYTLDADGTVTDKADAAQGYLIVGSGNDDYAMTDSLGATGVTITDNAITLDAQPDYEWWITSDGKITDGTNYLKFTGTYQASGSVSVTTNASEATSWDISHSSNGAYSISYAYSYGSWGTRETTYYLRYNSNAFSVTSSSNTVRLFSGAEVTTPATEGTPATPDTNGTYGKIVGNLTYEATIGMTADEAMALVKAGIDGYDYEAMSTPGSDVTGTIVDDGALTWEWVDTFDGNTAGDYEVAIKYGDSLLGTAEVVVPATTTYYVAEGNGLYLVDMNTTADNALAAVKAGVTVYSATDASGSNKTAIDDSLVTWNWVDTYNGADSGPYTVEILKDGTSLGTVEVKVNVKYETGITTDWTYIGETEATGGSYTYTLDTDGIDSDGQYIIVAEDQALALHTSGSSAATAVSVDISSDGNTLTTTTRDYEYYWNTTYGFTRDGYNGLYQSSWAIYLGTKDASYLDGVVNHNNGTYTLYDNEGNERGLYYNGSSWTVNNGGTTTDYKVRLYKYTGMTGGTSAGSIYAKIEGPTVYTVEQGTSATEAMAAVKAGITGYTATDANGTDKTELEDSKLTWKWKNTYASMVTGSYWVEISYNGEPLGIVEVKVEPGVVNNYPEYPDEGAVKVNKTATGVDFQSSGIAQVEVSASGVPIKKGADVIIMLDTSSSMAYCLNCTDTRHSSYVCDQGGQTRAQALEETLGDLIAQFKTPGDDGQLLDIDVAIADFNGFYGDSHSESGTPYDRDAADMMSDDISYTANSAAQVYTNGTGALDATAFVAAEDLAATYDLSYASGTNYDYAFDAIYQMATAKKIANGSEERDLYVIFMSDGAAMQWNYYHSQGASSLWNSWITGAWSADEVAANLNCTTHAYYYDEVDHDGDGIINEHRMANAIKGDPSETFEVIRKTSDLGTATGEDNMYMVPGLGAKLFSIAFDPRVDTNVTVASMEKSIASLASDQTGTTQYFYNVSSADALANAFTAIGAEIAYAASNARFVDQMGDNYNLQLKPFVDYKGDAIDADGDGTQDTPTIEIISYDIYTRQDWLNGDCQESQIGDRKGTYTILETVTFNADGTAAYSDQIDGGATNILADGTQAGYVKGVIYAKTFLYNTNATEVAVEGVSIPTGTNSDGTTTGSTNVLPSETFYWKLGTVQTSELAMRYYVYLDGSMEGTCEAGSYPTNEYATLYYDNYLENPCHKETVSPVMAWEAANVSYAFYLVDENGNIIVNQTTGETGSFANKIAVTNPVVYEEILLNNVDEVSSINVQSLGVLPTGYDLYDTSAVYTIRINSDATGSWEITKGSDKVASTYVTQYNTDPSAYSNELTNSDNSDDYTHTIVWFAVLWKVQALPDSVVIDYGLPVDISVLTNDMFGENGKLAGVGAYSDSLNLDGYDATLASGFGSSHTVTYGTAEADTTTGKVRYTPADMEMNGYEKFAYAVNYTGTTNPGYYYDTVTVIPATTIYYEDEFVTFDTLTWQQKEGGEAWEGEWAVVENPTTSIWTQVGTAVDATQSEDRPGKYSLTDANNIYGYDSVNMAMTTYSLGSAMKATVDYDNAAQASFTFYGTGFDVISMTDATTGTIFVHTYKVDANGERLDGDANADNGITPVNSFTVDTYYGYDYGLYNVTYTYTNGAWVETVGTKVTDENVTATEAVLPTDPAEGATATAIEERWVLDPNSSEHIWQVPVMKVADLEYGRYEAVIQAVYEPAFDHETANTATTYDFYLDAIRIYDPANDGAEDNDTVIEDAYVADGEGWPTYVELRNVLLNPDDLVSTDNGELGNDDTTTKVEGIVFIDGNEEVGQADIKLYESFGPNNEVYLATGQRVAFILDLPANVVNVHIGIKSADGNTGTYTITNIAQASNTETGVVAGDYYGAKTDTINTTTDMYYDLSGWRNDIIVISNTGDRYGTTGIISLTNIKFTYSSDPNGASAVSVMTLGLEDEVVEETAPTIGSVYMTSSAATLTLRSLNAPAVEETPDETVPETTIPEVTEPETTVPEVTEPETTVPEETEPEATEPETTVPEETEPETSEEEEFKTIVKEIIDFIGSWLGQWF